MGEEAGGQRPVRGIELLAARIDELGEAVVRLKAERDRYRTALEACTTQLGRYVDEDGHETGGPQGWVNDAPAEAWAGWETARRVLTTEPPRSSPPIQAVVFIFLRGAQVLMERCPKKESIHGGDWFIPGGRIEAGETEEVHALCREVYEELGVSVHDCTALPLVDAKGLSRKDSFLMRPFIVTAWHGDLPDHCLDRPDVPLRWVPFSEALASPTRAVRAVLAQLPQTNRWVPVPTGATWDRVREQPVLLSRGERTVLTVEAKLSEIFRPGHSAKVRDG